MKFKSVILLAILFMSSVITASAKMYCNPVYIFGLSASFNDSIVYITNIQVVDSAWFDEKSDFLINRSEYSNQLKNYFSSKGENNRTCIVTYAEKEKDILKKYKKMKSRYVPSKKKPKNFDLRTLDEEDFQFQAIKPIISDESEIVEKKKSSKKAEKTKLKKKEDLLDKANSKISKESASEPEVPFMPPRH